MSKATYTLELELSYNTWTDVTADWHTATPLVIERGIEPGECVAGVGRMTFALHNPDGRYTPGHENAVEGFGAGIGVRLRAGDGENTYMLFYGRVEEIAPRRAGAEHGAGHALPLQVDVMCVDEMAALERARVGVMPLLLHVRPGELIERLVTISFVPPGRFAYWRLDHPQAGRLGQATVLSDAATGVSIDAGQSEFPWAGDTWPADLPVPAALRDVCRSEGGQFYMAADGKPVFRDRHARPEHLTAEATLSGMLAGLMVEQGAGHVANRIAVSTHPREVGTANEVLWQAGHSVRIGPGETRTLTCPYRDPDQRAARVGALSLVMPVAGTDFTATDRADGTGTDLTETVRVRLETGASAARLTLWSTWTANRAVYIHDLQLRGVALRSYSPSTVIVEDVTSQFACGLRPLVMDMSLQDDTRVGEDMAHALLASRKDVHPWLTIQVEATVSDDLLTQTLARDVGDRLHITDATLLPEGGACFIEHVRHDIRQGGASHRVTWRTSPAEMTAYWVLGSSEQAALGTGTRIGY